jgi:3-hydroxybutyryl-CoA dehydratase
MTVANEYQWDDLEVGLRHEFTVTLTAEMMAAFAGISEDTNPLHVDADYAIGAGFPGPVAFGLLTSSFYSKLVGVHLPGRRALLHGIDLDFTSPAFVGDTLLVAGEISYLNDAHQQLELRARITNQDGKRVSRAKIRVGLHARGAEIPITAGQTG